MSEKDEKIGEKIEKDEKIGEKIEKDEKKKSQSTKTIIEPQKVDGPPTSEMLSNEIAQNPEVVTIPKGRGRPKGRKNRPKPPPTIQTEQPNPSQTGGSEPVQPDDSAVKKAAIRGMVFAFSQITCSMAKLRPLTTQEIDLLTDATVPVAEKYGASALGPEWTLAAVAAMVFVPRILEPKPEPTFFAKPVQPIQPLPQPAPVEQPKPVEPESSFGNEFPKTASFFSPDDFSDRRSS